ncbi:beta-mannosidase-like isoform X2 [Asterias amurensis]
MRLKYLGLIIVLLVISTRAEVKVDLGGLWALTNANRSISIPATVPGGVYTALQTAGIINDPYTEYNDVLYRWVAYDNWTYTRTISVTSKQLTSKNVRLICEGLDTISLITVNGKTIGRSKNMFIRYEFDLKAVLKEGNNTISIAFQSAITYALDKWKAHKAYDVPPDCPPDVQHGICHPNFIRKEQSSFAWDWGPGFASQGIWKDIRIETFDCAVIRDVVATAIPFTDLHLTPWSIQVTAFFELGASVSCSGILQADFKVLNVSHSATVKLTKQKTNFSMKFQVQKAKTWWPAGFGDQQLYQLQVSFSNGGRSSDDQDSSTKSLLFGFRRVELVEKSVTDIKNDAAGLSFFFNINNQRTFIKGANWIPADAFQERVSRPRLERLLQSLVDANMHATRVWGGGVYEQDAFYEICDALGIVVWQDFMFACAMYPVDEEFLSSVKSEVIQQTRRLASHPSIIAWSANNENEVALRQNWYGTANNFSLYQKDFVTLYINTILDAVRENSKLPAVSSSPSNGPESEAEGWVAQDPTDPHYGDVHYYNYNDDCWNTSIYPKPRFASEYGFQSWPSLETLRQVSKAGDWSMDSNFSMHRQHHQNGNKQMMDQITRHFVDSTSRNTTQRFMNRIYLTQISQALCYKYETEHYRRLQSTLIDGEGMTMGAVYWQLNDIWQAPSWASIEYQGKWKMLHYYAKDFFAPLLASGVENNDVLSVYVITDVHPILNGTLNISVWSWASQTPLKSWQFPFKQHVRQSAVAYYVRKTADILSEANCPKREACFLTFQVTGITPSLTSPLNPYFLTSFIKAVGLKQPKIAHSVLQIEGDTFSIQLSSPAIAPFVWLEAPGLQGRFSDNGFLMVEESHTVEFYAWTSTTLEELKQSLAVKSLLDVYNDEE